MSAVQSHEFTLWTLGFLGPLFAAFWAYNYKEVQSRTKMLIHNDNVYHLLVELGEILVRQYIAVVNFSSEIFDEKRFLGSSGYGGLNCPIFNCSALAQILQNCNWVEIEDPKLRELISEILIKTDVLNRTGEQIAKLFENFKENHRHPLNRVITKEASKSPGSTGLIFLEEFNKISDMRAILSEYRKECYGTFIRIQRAIDQVRESAMTGSFAYHKTIKHLNKFLQDIARIDCEAPIELHYYKLAMEVNEFRDTLRINILNSAIREKNGIKQIKDSA